jgi:hypothetical protein
MKNPETEKIMEQLRTKIRENSHYGVWSNAYFEHYGKIPNIDKVIKYLIEEMTGE